MGVCNVFNIERFATEDGRGIRTVIFLKGCSLRCRWCANPESQRPGAEVLVKTNVCINCARCSVLCPEKAISYIEGYGFITDQSKCRQCGVCIRECYADAREMMGRKYNEEELLTEILKDRQYYGMSGGGVTFSGGEPLYYSEIIGAVGEQMHRRGYNTLVETCGHVPQKALEDINGRVDYIYYDFKQIDPEKHKELTGVDNTLILSNLEWLCGHYSGELSVRYPYIPGCNDDEASINGFFEYIKSLNHISEIVFLPYHRLGLPKYQGLGRAYEMGNMPSLKKADLLFLVQRAEKYGLKIKIQ
ncbi:glycyl-radical enzyme activating protein [Enterocloster bolteae]|uniref:glycyl-radical enzyme activating protein n=1 Tax=Enterocloster bolteae TaxID=208479 RepID=UPI002A800933|nr:glycyl-radical enzyme activating protein [Enterocloster bolteae]